MKLYGIRVIPTLISDEELELGHYKDVLKIAQSGALDYNVTEEELDNTLQIEKEGMLSSNNYIEGIIIVKRVK